ncbi:nuclear transport factor 2 family protein [Pleionea sediminis]|uniref:nuclear transport factor 2 family protein n=1 Tax=Pleionea sediminis TaxID=2569479 RepID=UPI00197B3EE2|nr:nuclear transport factor 2 family protein [Pleionea sediminis]
MIKLGCWFVLMGLWPTVWANENNEKDRVNQVLDAMHQAASSADGEAYFNFFSEDATYIGTDIGETWTISQFKEFAMPYFSKGKGWTYRPVRRQLAFSQSGDVVWFVEILLNDKYGKSRGTGVLERHENSWKIVQYHLTFPLPNELAVKITQEIKQFEMDEK